MRKILLRIVLEVAFLATSKIFITQFLADTFQATYSLNKDLYHIGAHLKIQERNVLQFLK